jgi:hypothetical protein
MDFRKLSYWLMVPGLLCLVVAIYLINTRETVFAGTIAGGVTADSTENRQKEANAKLFGIIGGVALIGGLGVYFSAKKPEPKP